MLILSFIKYPSIIYRIYNTVCASLSRTFSDSIIIKFAKPTQTILQCFPFNTLLEVEYFLLRFLFFFCFSTEGNGLFRKKKNKGIKRKAYNVYECVLLLYGIYTSNGSVKLTLAKSCTTHITL